MSGLEQVGFYSELQGSLGWRRTKMEGWRKEKQERERDTRRGAVLKRN